MIFVRKRLEDDIKNAKNLPSLPNLPHVKVLNQPQPIKNVLKPGAKKIPMMQKPSTGKESKQRD